MIDWTGFAHPKGQKGDVYIHARERRKDTQREEKAAKQEVRARDKKCRWPHCENCKVYKPRLEVAHIVAKGAGGDHGLRSARTQMILLDMLTHQGGIDSLEQHGRKIVPLTDKGTDAACEFWKLGKDGQWFLVARERAPFVYERD